MLSPAQRDEFQRRGVLRLPATIPAAATAAMREHLWRYLGQVHGSHPDRPATWTVRAPSHFQKLTATGAFDAMATDEVVAAVDDLLGVGRWHRPSHWGRPLVTFPRRDTDWTVPTRGWHLDSHGDLDDLTMLVVFAHLARVRSRGGGTLVVTGSHHLTTPRGPGRGTAPVRSAEVKAHLGRVHPWLRELWTAGDRTDRIRRYLERGAVIDGVPVRVEELTGEPGDVLVMHPRVLHAVAPNSRTTPRLMLLQFLYAR